MPGHWHKQFRRSKKLERTDADGTVFHSKGELARWKKLQQWQIAGHIRNLRRQVAYPLVIHDTLADARPILTPTGRTAVYVADFVYERLDGQYEGPQDTIKDRWVEVIEDFKGYQSRENAFKIAVFEALHGKKVSFSKAVRS
jgi:hypothetical protein